MKDNKGGWVLADLGGGKVNATYNIEVTVGMQTRGVSSAGLYGSVGTVVGVVIRPSCRSRAVHHGRFAPCIIIGKADVGIVRVIDACQVSGVIDRVVCGVGPAVGVANSPTFLNLTEEHQSHQGLP